MKAISKPIRATVQIQYFLFKITKFERTSESDLLWRKMLFHFVCHSALQQNWNGFLVEIILIEKLVYNAHRSHDREHINRNAKISMLTSHVIHDKYISSGHGLKRNSGASAKRYAIGIFFLFWFSISYCDILKRNSFKYLLSKPNHSQNSVFNQQNLKHCSFSDRKRVNSRITATNNSLCINICRPIFRSLWQCIVSENLERKERRREKKRVKKQPINFGCEAHLKNTHTSKQQTKKENSNRWIYSSFI